MTLERRNVAEMITFTYQITDDGSSSFRWNTIVYGPDGKRIGSEYNSSATFWGAHWRARQIVNNHMKTKKRQKKQVEKTASPDFTGSIHRYKV